MKIKSEKQRQAIEAFKDGCISLRKLSEDMGMNVWEIQSWLKEHDIPQNSTFLEDDVAHA